MEMEGLPSSSLILTPRYENHRTQFCSGLLAGLEIGTRYHQFTPQTTSAAIAKKNVHYFEAEWLKLKISLFGSSANRHYGYGQQKHGIGGFILFIQIKHNIEITPKPPNGGGEKP